MTIDKNKISFTPIGNARVQLTVVYNGLRCVINGYTALDTDDIGKNKRIDKWAIDNNITLLGV